MRGDPKNTRVRRHRSVRNGEPLKNRVRQQSRRGRGKWDRFDPRHERPEVVRRRELRVADWIEWAQERCGSHDIVMCPACRPDNLREMALYADRSGS